MRLRTLKFGINVVVMTFFMAMIILYVNYLGARHYKRFDLTGTDFYSLSEKSIKILDSLDSNVRAIVIFDPQHLLYQHALDLLKEYEYISDKILVEDVDPYRDQARTKELAQRYNIETANVVIFAQGEKSKVVSVEDMADYDYSPMQYGGQPRMAGFKGEQAFGSAILEITQTRQMRVAFSTGHGELDIDSIKVNGIVSAASKLKADNFKVETIALVGEERISSDIDLIIIAGPVKSFTEPEIGLLQNYVDSGGDALFLLDPLVETGLEDLLDGFGIVVGEDIVIDPAKKLPFVSAANLYVDDYDTEHDITKGMDGVASIFPLARSVDKAEDIPEGHSITIIAKTSEDGWGEQDLTNDVFTFEPEVDKKGPVPIACALESSDEDGKTSRIVVFGNSQFITNTQIGNLGNSDIFVNTVHWLAGKSELISITPKTPENAQLTMSASQIRGLFWSTVIGMPFGVFVIGGAVWFRRRT